MPQRLGQHFLQDTAVLRRIAGALDIRANDIMIEIGPGHGELTDELKKKKPARLLLIEKDPLLAEALEKKYEEHSAGPAGSVIPSIYRGDVRRDLASLVDKEVPGEATYIVAGNIPYYLTGFLLRILGELPRKPARIVLTMQEEVARRLADRPPRMNKLAASVQFWSDPEILMMIPSAAFKPPPNVSSAVVRLTTKPVPMDPKQYFSCIHKVFAQPRKTIGNNLIPKGASPEEKAEIHAALTALGVSVSARPHDLGILELIGLAKTLGA